MTVQEFLPLIQGEELCSIPEDKEILAAYTSDLLSDVMAHAQEGQALITIQAHKNTIAVATLFGASCIIVCNSRPVPEDMRAAAAQEGLPLIRTGLNQYEVSGLLYTALKEEQNHG